MLGFPILFRNGPVAEHEFEPKPKLRTCNLPLLVVTPSPQWVVRIPAVPVCRLTSSLKKRPAPLSRLSSFPDLKPSIDSASFYKFFRPASRRQSIEPLVTWIFIRGIRASSRFLIPLHVGRDPTVYRRPASGSAFDA